MIKEKNKKRLTIIIKKKIKKKIIKKKAIKSKSRKNN